MEWRECLWHIAFPGLEFHDGPGRGLCSSGSLGMRAVPRGGGGAAPLMRPLADVGGMCSTWRVPLSPGLLQPFGLLAGGGRALPPRCHGAEGFARYVCYVRLPSHIVRRRVGSMALLVTRCLRMADEAQKSSRYIRPLLVATRRGV
jgi:hypothetical protein